MPAVEAAKSRTVPQGTLVTHQELKRIRALRQAGRLIREIVDATGRSPGTIRRLTAGIETERGYEFVTDEERQRMRALRERRFSYQRIAAEVGRDASTVWKHTRDMRVSAKDQSDRNARLVMAWSAARSTAERAAIARRFGLKNAASAAVIVCIYRKKLRAAA